MKAELLIRSLIVSLVLTLMLELGFALILGVRGRRNLALVALVNVLTNLPVVLLCSLFPSPLLTIAAELSAVFIEGVIYRAGTDFRRPMLFSLSANAFSYLIGLALNALTRYLL